MANFSYSQRTKNVISAKEARKLLGKSAKNLTNEELDNLISQTETVVRLIIRKYIGSKDSDKSAKMYTEMSRNR